MSLALSESNECGDPDLLLSPSSTLCSTSPIFASLDLFPLPRLEISSLDTSPFSTKNSFHGLIEDDLDLLTWRQDTKAANDQDISYDIERYSNMKELVPGWEDDDVDEILVMCPKTERQLTTIEEESSRVQTISLADFEALPEHLRAANGGPLYRKLETGRLYVLKRFPKRNKSTSERDVLEILMDIKAPFLSRIDCSFSNEDSFCVAMEYCSRENIKELVSCEGALKPERARFFACEILQALTVLHAAGIIHRDLRPENIIIDNAGHIVVEGFEDSEILPYSNKSRDPIFCTTPTGKVSAFSAPELLLSWSHDYLVDTWGFGMLLLFMISGKHLFDDCDTSPVSWKKMVIYSPIVLPLLEMTARDLMTRCLERNPMARPSLLQVKKHNYFSAVDWKKVAAKRIRAPCPLHVTIDQDRNHFRSRLDKVVSSIPRTRSWRSRTRSHVSSVLGVKTPENASVNTEDIQVYSSMASVFPLDDLFGTTKTATTPTGLPVYSSWSLNNASPSPPRLDWSPQDRMASFWDFLDSDQAITSSETPNPPDPAHRPRKLRKSRSSIYPEHRVSALSTLSLQNLTKLRKFGQSTSALPRSSPILDLPEGIKQIGGGIGFKYNVPTAAKSKASVSTNTPQTCHGFFNGRLHGLGLGLLRSPTAIAKDRARRALKSLVIPAKQDDLQAFPTEFRGSNWSFVVPVLQESCMDTAGTVSVANSPISEPAPFTPTTLDCGHIDVASAEDEENFVENRGDEPIGSDAPMTLRLVLSKGDVY